MLNLLENVLGSLYLEIHFLGFGFHQDLLGFGDFFFGVFFFWAGYEIIDGGGLIPFLSIRLRYLKPFPAFLLLLPLFLPLLQLTLNLLVHSRLIPIYFRTPAKH